MLFNLIFITKNMSNKILITGANGFIGKNLKKYLILKGYKIINYKKNCKVTDAKQFLHLQFFISKNKNKFYKKNLFLTKEICLYCTKHNIDLIFLSSHLPIKTKEIIKYNSYQLAKLDSESLIVKKFFQKNCNYKIVRLSNVYGKNCKYGIISDLIKKMKKKVLIINNTNKFRDFIFIDDVVKIIFKLINVKKSFKVFLGTGKKIKIINLINKIKLLFNYNCKINYGNNDDDYYKLNFNNKKLMKIIGNYKFKNIDQGLRKIRPF